ncbi:hypothetical protein ThrDRAFT_00509 [Frankia casuarinae]|jgi:hypothetical protein|uniref:Uncharacterized protein n=2 Tax=Frankiaceae TaxID=74712 RepID=Q2J652_FRACC|nr:MULTISPECIES: hypothetical protein [Frankia]ETA03890.1 hypothetical protein CcI6DRAFT_00727 [Frankia sp. CcI6]KDA44403.1 hypothetical protein BMG523Draft_00577 [Frankia sp. BMG5.23]KFB06401.1 hypothetical protein ALLO2DRAFT_00929 [Frankia sp. Allo2]ABD13240.1 hypothetical protein Francci3_3890 [Frankia casuarinae]EYT93759.1 hypothetical protein ThrDRAFT_00509 [Frankia casuarinae]
MDYVMDLSESEWGTPAPDRTGSWAIVVLEQGTRQVQGVIGPFRSPGHAQAYACDGGFADWLIVPSLYLMSPTEPEIAAIAVL